MKQDLIMLLTWTRVPKRLIYLVIVIPLFGLLLTSAATAEEDKQLAKAIGFLSTERSLAKSYAFILEEFGKDDIDNYVSGIKLYAVAKAEFDGLIEQLKWNLSHGVVLEDSADFTKALNQAAEHRIAFTSLIDEKIITHKPGSKNPLILAAITTIPELTKAITEAAISIWSEYRQVDKEQKKEILDTLDSAKWPDYSEIGGTG